MKHLKRFLLIFIVAVVTIASAYIAVEAQTKLFGKETKELYCLTDMISEENEQKVFYYLGNKAKVLYISDDTCDMVYCSRDADGNWHLDSWKTVFSEYGSADSWTFPMYYPKA